MTVPVRAALYRRDHPRALAQRIEVDEKEVRIMGSKSALLRTHVAASSGKSAAFGVPSFLPKWRAKQCASNQSLNSSWRENREKYRVKRRKFRCSQLESAKAPI